MNSTAALLARHGVLRAVINLGNPILARRTPEGGVAGLSVELAGRLASQLGAQLETIVVETAAASVASVAVGEADVGFFAIDPQRGEQLAFTPPYVLIEGSYLVQADSPLQRNEEVDRAGRTVVVGQGSAYDLFLSRELKAATILRAPSSQAVVETFLREGADVAAGVRQQLEADAARLPGLRLLDGRFMVIQQAMACARLRGPAAAARLAAFVEDAKASGFVAEAMVRQGVQGAIVAPAAAAA
jgi:polar amino acid transport system substrate-binding protein